MSEVKTPWIKNLGGIPATLIYKDGSLFDAVCRVAEKHPELIAYDFMGRKVTYAAFCVEVRRCARALAALGIKKGDRVNICMPNMPQSVAMFYAVNLIGAVSNLVHPLSSANEIAFYLADTESVACLTLDMNYEKLEEARKSYDLRHLIITGVGDALSPVKRLGYKLTQGRKVKKVPADAPVICWNDFLKTGDAYTGRYEETRLPKEESVILYSGGTTGKMKGICLTDMNFNALGEQIVATNPMFAPGDSMLAVMPVFHGFGLGVCIHSMLSQGGRCILVPRFNAESYAELLKKYRPNFIAGVPTLYEALLRVPAVKNLELSCLKGVFSGGDSLPIELKKRFDSFLEAHGATIQVREGYGTTECVTASCLTPMHMAKEGSIGLPFPDTFYRIVAVGTEEEVPYGAEGEICLSGPTVMKGYLNCPQETADTLKVHADGLSWVHTGDLGMMDEDGFIYFRQRIKRMIITSGYNVYPTQVENVLCGHKYVHLCCVIGVPDSYKMQKVKAFVVLKPGIEAGDEVKKELIDYCRKNMIRYAVPYDIEFREDLPKTLVGKIAYRMLEEEELQKNK
ncbi:MAG: class I adenylate-forming enzyme family protein [Oscillospiraceae bacterium]